MHSCIDGVGGILFRSVLSGNATSCMSPVPLSWARYRAGVGRNEGM
jgi:hypothetical protein